MKVRHGRTMVQRFVLPIVGFVAETGRTSVSDLQKKIIRKLLQKNVIIDIICSSGQVDLFII